jgi:hypothetical protein
LPPICIRQSRLIFFLFQLFHLPSHFRPYFPCFP